MCIKYLYSNSYNPNTVCSIFIKQNEIKIGMSSHSPATSFATSFRLFSDPKSFEMSSARHLVHSDDVFDDLNTKVRTMKVFTIASTVLTHLQSLDQEPKQDDKPHDCLHHGREVNKPKRTLDAYKFSL
jgi:hypothetical protein